MTEAQEREAPPSAKPADEIILETECPRCNGFGSDGPFAHNYCRKCDGAGYIPTELGQKFVDLMRHNFGPMLRDAGNEG